jgi:hypothetical protein
VARVTVLRRRPASSAPRADVARRCSVHRHFLRESSMGKYFLAWLLGVPGVVLLLVYLFFH